MRVVNRTAVTIIGAKPYLDWMRDTDADFNKGAITVPRAKAYGSAFLLPEFELEEDLREWVEDNVTWLFEFQLGGVDRGRVDVAGDAGLRDVQGMVPRRHPQRGRRRRRR